MLVKEVRGPYPEPVLIPDRRASGTRAMGEQVQHQSTTTTGEQSDGRTTTDDEVTTLRAPD